MSDLSLTLSPLPTDFVLGECSWGRKFTYSAMRHHITFATPCCAAGWISRKKHTVQTCARCGLEYGPLAARGLFLPEGDLAGALELDFDPLTATLLAEVLLARLTTTMEFLRAETDWARRTSFLKRLSGVLMPLPDSVG